MARTLFNSSEKSNFILNMTEEQYSKLASYGLIGACLLVPLFTIIPECFSTATYTFSSGGLVIAGVYCMIMAMIALIKKYVNGGTVLPVCAFAAMLVWSVISMLDSYDIAVGMYGYPQRGEGVMAILFYCAIFVSAASIKTENSVDTLLKGIIAAGLLNSVWALIQVFTGKLTHYRFISLDIDANAASGLAQSPLFLAMLLTLSLTAALIFAVKSEGKKARIISLVSAALFGFVMIMTYTVIAVCGMVLAAVLTIAVVFIIKAPKSRLLTLLAPAAAAVLAVVIVNAGAVGGISSYKFYDARELWWADSYMRAGSAGDFNSDIVNIDDNVDVYLYLDRKGLDLASRFPLTGTGPDQLVYPQLYTWGTLNENAEMPDVIVQNRGTFDRVYNEYIYTAATRGYPSLITLLAVILPALFISFKAMKKRRNAETAAVFILTLCGALMFLISCGSLAYSPIYWSAAGLACASLRKKTVGSKK
ncbi:MAG: O-antigen ligase family protein [Ruminococcus sp.]|nr:O-antigen ligase family protein [Ruminococcus sp.]